MFRLRRRIHRQQRVSMSNMAIPHICLIFLTTLLHRPTNPRIFSISQKRAHVVYVDNAKGGLAWTASWRQGCCCCSASPYRLCPSSCVSASSTRSDSPSHSTQPAQASTARCTPSDPLHLCLATPNRGNAARATYTHQPDDDDDRTCIHPSRRDGQLCRARIWRRIPRCWCARLRRLRFCCVRGDPDSRAAIQNKTGHGHVHVSFWKWVFDASATTTATSGDRCCPCYDGF